MEASEKLTIQALKAHDKVHPKFKSAGKSLKQKSRASLLSSPEDPSEVNQLKSFFLIITKKGKRNKLLLICPTHSANKKSCKRLEIPRNGNLLLFIFFILVHFNFH